MNNDEEDSCNKNQSENKERQPTFIIIGALMVKKKYGPKLS